MLSRNPRSYLNINKWNTFWKFGENPTWWRHFMSRDVTNCDLSKNAEENADVSKVYYTAVVWQKALSPFFSKFVFLQKMTCYVKAHLLVPSFVTWLSRVMKYGGTKSTTFLIYPDIGLTKGTKSQFPILLVWKIFSGLSAFCGTTFVFQFFAFFSKSQFCDLVPFVRPRQHTYGHTDISIWHTDISI